MLKVSNKENAAGNDVTIKVDTLLLTALAALMLIVFINAGFSLFCGPLIAALLCVLFFRGHEEFVTAVIIVANDALGTIVLGSLSFHYLLLALLACRLLNTKTINVRTGLFVALGAYLLLQQYFLTFSR